MRHLPGAKVLSEADTCGFSLGLFLFSTLWVQCYRYFPEILSAPF